MGYNIGLCRILWYNMPGGGYNIVVYRGTDLLMGSIL